MFLSPERASRKTFPTPDGETLSPYGTCRGNIPQPRRCQQGDVPEPGWGNRDIPEPTQGPGRKMSPSTNGASEEMLLSPDRVEPRWGSDREKFLSPGRAYIGNILQLRQGPGRRRRHS